MQTGLAKKTKILYVELRQLPLKLWSTSTHPFMVSPGISSIRSPGAASASPSKIKTPPTSTFHGLHQWSFFHNYINLPHITPVTPPWCQRSHPQMLLTFQHKLNWEGAMRLDWLQSPPFSSLFISNTMEQSSLKLNKTKVTRDKQSLLFYWPNTNFLPISGISWMVTKLKVRHSCLPSVASAIGCF